MLDIHEAAIARDLCMLILLDNLNHTNEPKTRDEIKSTLMYMFLAPVMPNYSHSWCVRIYPESVSVTHQSVVSGRSWRIFGHAC